VGNSEFMRSDEETSFSGGSLPPYPIVVSKEEVEAILRSQKPFKAPGTSGIPNGYLRAMGPKMAEAVQT
jgi:hypothetical protein